MRIALIRSVLPILVVLASLVLGCDGGGSTTDGGGGTDSGGGGEPCTPPTDDAFAISNGVTSLAVPRFAPSSDRVATLYGAAGSAVQGIRVLDLCGNILRELDVTGTERDSLAWSDDGATLYFVNGSGVGEVPSSGGADTALIESADYLDVSPDGSTIAFTAGGTLRFFEIGTSTATGTTITATFPRYSPDGTRVAVASGPTLYTIEVGTMAMTEIVPIEAIAFQPFDWIDDTSFALATPTGIDRITLGAGAPARETIVTTTDALNLDVSPDGTLLVYRINNEPELLVQRL
jgi:hypothetical protein